MNLGVHYAKMSVILSARPKAGAMWMCCDMEAKRSIEILDPEHREHYDSIEIVEVGLVDVHLCDEIPDGCNKNKISGESMKIIIPETQQSLNKYEGRLNG